MSVGIVDKQTGDRIPTAGMPAIDNALDLTSVNPVQNAIVTAALANKQDKTDNSLQTTDKTVVGGINELKSGFTNLDNEVNGDATVYPYADVITIEDAVPSNLADCSVKIEPVQDLHGYDNPWVGGAGKNKCPNKAYKANSYTLYVGQDDDTSFPFALVGGTTYTLSFVSELSPILIYLREENAASGTLVNNTFTPSASGNYRIAISVDGIDTTNVSNIQLELGSSSTDYEPYSNLCPISGHTEVDVQRVGVNLFDKNDVTAEYIKPDGHIYNGGADFKLSNYIRINGTFTISGHRQGNYEAGLCFYDKYKNYISGQKYMQDSPATITPPNNAVYTRISFWTSEINGNKVELGSTATPYEPYAGKTYTIALGDTIYGGTVDFDSGVMTVDSVLLDIASLNWEVRTDETIRATISTAAAFVSQTTAVDAICSNYVVSDQYHSGDNKPCISFNTATQIYINDDTHTFTTKEDAQQYLTGATLCYKVATPTTIQLTPQQIQLLKGQNTLTASTGDISVTVNGVSGAIGAVQTAVNNISEQLPTAPTTDGAYVLTVTVADGVPSYSWVSGS